MKEQIEHIDGFDVVSRKVFRVSNGRIESRAIRDFFDSTLEKGDAVKLYRATRKMTVEVGPGDTIIRKVE